MPETEYVRQIADLTRRVIELEQAIELLRRAVARADIDARYAAATALTAEIGIYGD
jgi:hypothetical protein